MMTLPDELKSYKDFIIVLVIGLAASVFFFLIFLKYETNKEAEEFRYYSQLAFYTFEKELTKEIKNFINLSQNLSNMKKSPNNSRLCIENTYIKSQCAGTHKLLQIQKNFYTIGNQQIDLSFYKNGYLHLSTLLPRKTIYTLLNAKDLIQKSKLSIPARIRKTLQFCIDVEGENTQKKRFFCEFEPSDSYYNLSEPLRLETIKVGLSEWSLKTYSNNMFSVNQTYLYPFIVLIVGLLLTLTSGIWAFSNTAHKLTLNHQNKKLQRTLAKLQSQNEDLEQFSFMASHDLQTPLKNIFSYSTLVQTEIEENNKENSLEFAKVISSETQRMLDYVRDLLDFSRTGRDSLNVELFNPLEIISKEAKLIKNTAECNNLKIKFEYKNIPDQIWADKIKVTHIFQNLIGNAVKYSKANQDICIEFDCRHHSEEPFWIFSVTDNGIGIRKRDFKKVFLPFRRANDQKKGTGIGLALVKKMVELHYGTIWIESEINEYTRFLFTLPSDQSLKIEKERKNENT